MVRTDARPLYSLQLFPVLEGAVGSLIERKDDNKSDLEYIVRASANEVKALLVFLSNRRDSARVR